MKRLLGLLSLLLATPALADGLVDRVNGITLDAQGRVQRFSAMVVDKQGRVARLLTAPEPPPRWDKKRKAWVGATYQWRADMAGKTVIPGFVDAHGHLLELGFRLLELDLSGARSFDEAKAMIRGYAAANPDRTWIVGGGWNQESWGLGRFPTAAELDALVPDRPVWLARVDGHAGWANALAMKAAGVTAKTPAPAGGRIENGVFVDQAKVLIERALPKPSAKDREAALLKAQERLLALGVTALADMGTTLDDWMTLRRLGDRGALRVRVMSYALGIDNAVAIGGAGPTPWLYDGKLRMGGVKLYADGALGSRGAWLKAPYADAAGERGLGFLTDDQLQNLMSRAAMDGFQVAVHAIGDRANAQVLDAIAVLNLTYKGDRRWRIEHVQVVDPADLPRFKPLGVIASMQPTHATSDWRMAEARLGPARLAGAYAWATMLRNGVPLAFGSDFPVESPDPFAGWAAAIGREDADGRPAGGWRPEERVTREQAWWAFTAGAAYAGFAEGEFGRLAPGQWADFVVLDSDPLLATPRELRATKVFETWVAGVKLYRRP